MKKDAFIEVHSLTQLRDAVRTALDAGAGHPAMVMATGEAGTGKTVAARTIYAELGGVYLRAMEGMSQHAFLQELCFELDGSRPHGVARCKQQLVEQLKAEPQAFFMDEADRLHISRLEDLRDLHDLTGSPMVLIGELGLPLRVKARSRINDRIPEACRVKFGGISARDVALFAAQAADLSLSPEAASLVQAATGMGNFRKVYGAVLTLEKAARAAGTGEINADLARRALGLDARSKAHAS